VKSLNIKLSVKTTDISKFYYFLKIGIFWQIIAEIEIFAYVAVVKYLPIFTMAITNIGRYFTKSI